MNSNQINDRHELYLDNFCGSFYCNNNIAVKSKLPYTIDRATGDHSVTCLNCGKSTIIDVRRIESDFDDIINDILGDKWMCPKSENPCRIECVHYTKPHIDRNNKIIDLSFCDLHAV